MNEPVRHDPVPEAGRENLRRQVQLSGRSLPPLPTWMYVMVGFGLAAGFAAPILTWLIVREQDPGVTNLILGLLAISTILMALLWIWGEE